MSTGWMTVVATMPAAPPLTKGRAVRMNGERRASCVACLGLSLAFSSAAGVSAATSLAVLTAASAFLLAASTAELILSRGGGVVLSKNKTVGSNSLLAEDG